LSEIQNKIRRLKQRRFISVHFTGTMRPCQLRMLLSSTFTSLKDLTPVLRMSWSSWWDPNKTQVTFTRAPTEQDIWITWFASETMDTKINMVLVSYWEL
jgi:hypothetical protein